MKINDLVAATMLFFTGFLVCVFLQGLFEEGKN